MRGNHVKVLAFEDGADIALLLCEGGIEYNSLTFKQYWDTEDAIEKIRDFAPDILLLDHYIPPIRGLDVLRMVNAAVEMEELSRPEIIVGMSSMPAANHKMLEEGANHGIIKSALATLEIWPRLHS